MDVYAQCQKHRRKCMPPLMPSDVLGDAAPFGDGTDSVKTSIIVRYKEYPAVFVQPAVLVYNTSGKVEQADVGFHSGLLTVDVYPLEVVEVGADVLFAEIAHILERQAGECTKQVEVTIKLLLGVLQLAVHQQADFLFCEERAGGFLLFDFILSERVARQPFVVDGDEHHRPQGADV